jgi:uncharacterized membrane protein YdjX (TVP38/TMEM64 family)
MRLLRVLNLPRHVLNLAAGHDHPAWQRYAVGAVLMVLGIATYRLGDILASHLDVHLLGFVTDGIGFFIHGAGLTPYLEAFAESK